MLVIVLIDQREGDHAGRGDRWRRELDGLIVQHIARDRTELTKLNRDFVGDNNARRFCGVPQDVRCCIVERNVHDAASIDENRISFTNIAVAGDRADLPI